MIDLGRNRPPPVDPATGAARVRRNVIHRTSLAFLLLAPALAVMAFSGVVPLGFAVYYAFHDVFAGNSFVWVGTQWFETVLTSPDFWAAIGRTAGFTVLVLLVEVPLGLWIAVRMPAQGLLASICW